LVALLFFADATLKDAMRTKNGSPVTSQRIGLSAPRSHDAIKTLNTAPAPAPDMMSEAVLAAQPKSTRDALATIESAAREARAEAPPKKTRPKEPPQKVRDAAKNARLRSATPKSASYAVHLWPTEPIRQIFD
jgi:hypothetical protein